MKSLCYTLERIFPFPLVFSLMRPVVWDFGGGMVTHEDSQLVQRAKADPEAFGELYQLHMDRIYRYIYHRTGSISDAEDLTERVFVQALTHLSGYTDRGLPFSVWLFRIAHNLVANWHRDRSRNRVVPLDGVVMAFQDRDVLEDVEEANVVRRAVARLSPERQRVLLLKFVEELPHAEIGKIMGRSEGAVKALLHRTLKALKEEIQVNYDEQRSTSIK